MDVIGICGSIMVNQVMACSSLGFSAASFWFVWFSHVLTECHMTVLKESCNHVCDALFTRILHNYPQLMSELNIRGQWIDCLS